MQENTQSENTLAQQLAAPISNLNESKDEKLKNGLALTPPMGWNTWNKFGIHINEALIKDTAKAMVDTGMRAVGYQYIIIDDGWQVGRDKKGVLRADPKSFPHGMKALGDYIHSQGLKFGIYTDAGTRTCQGRPGSYHYEQLDVKTFASWGVDYVKVDWCLTQGLNPIVQYGKFSTAIRDTGRPMVLSICSKAITSPWEWGPRIGNLWRTTNDIQDNWHSFLSNLDHNALYAKYASPGGWNDPDMLEVGNRGMTETEYRSQFSLWAIMAAPLIAGNDLRTMDAITKGILTHPEIIMVDQDPAGIQGKVVSQDGTGLQVWSKPLADGTFAVALFNRSENTASIHASWQSVGVTTPLGEVRDLWQRKDLGVFHTGFSAEVPPHDTVVIKVTGRRG